MSVDTYMNNSHKILILSFVSTLIIFLGLLYITINSAIHRDEYMNFIFAEREKAILFSRVRDIANRRSITLHKMTAAEDSFSKDKYFQQFLEAGSTGITLRDQILKKYPSQHMTETMDSLRPIFAEAKTASERVVDLVQRDQIKEAKSLLFIDVQNAQEQLNQRINEIIETQNNLIDERIEHNDEHKSTSNYLIVVFFFTFLLVAFLLQHTTRRALKSENQIVEQAKRIRSLYEITSLSTGSFEEQVRKTLSLGCEALGLEAGKVAKIDGENETNQVEYLVYDDDGIDVREGIVLPLAQTYCDIPYRSEKPIAIHHASNSEFRNHPGFHRSIMETYIAVPIWVNNKKYGTVSFSGKPPRSPFNETEIDVVKLIAQWVSVNIERERSHLIELGKQRADAANQAKSEFLAHMSHEIRTPLTAIIGFADASLDVDQSVRERITALRTISNSGKHLNNIINDILDVSKVEAGKLQVEHIECSVTAILSEIKELMTYQAQSKGLKFSIEYEFPFPDKIMSDPVRIKQILLNLCSNAIKFTSHGFVKIKASFDAENKSLLFDVLDSGIGMSEEELSKVFEAFVQANTTTTRHFGGTGLGLSLSRKLAQLVNGDITVTSTSGVGSCFHFLLNSEIPANSVLLNNSQEVVNINNGQRRRPTIDKRYKGRILVADDTIENQQLLKVYLNKLGVEIYTANNGKEALKQLNQFQFDLILMDMQMPVMDGAEAVTKIRSKKLDIPILALTADVMPHHIEKYQQIGCNDFIAKPIDLEQFYRTVTRYLLIDERSPSQEDTPIISELLAEEPDLANVVQYFAKKLPGYISSILENIDKRDDESLKQALHTLKGSAGNVGYPQLAEVIRKMEYILLSQNYDEFENQKQQLMSISKRIYQGINNDK